MPFLGLDIGSTTVKALVLGERGDILFARYLRHGSEVRPTVARLLHDVAAAVPGGMWRVAACGSGAMALAVEMELPFVQEVIASGLAIRKFLPQTDVAIELGGEDAKITFFTGGAEQRMNETCAGGTGAFIDQMAAFLDTDAAGLDALAAGHTRIYPIASRCGVFAKTDLLPLINEGCPREDIAASIFQAVVDQTVSGLACGREIKGKVAFLGGPLAFLPTLRRLFKETLCLDDESALMPEKAEYFVALGAALFASEQLEGDTSPYYAADLTRISQRLEAEDAIRETATMPPLFASPQELKEFRARHMAGAIPRARLEDLNGDAWLGLDSGSTTIKAALIDDQGRLLFSHYSANKGDPLHAALGILRDIYSRMPSTGRIKATAVTGYGSALLKAALRADVDEVETVAHSAGARHFMPEVDFILDIGGQDIKCLHLRGGEIDRIQLNEACSSGCGSFVETFAKSLGLTLPDFIEAALSARNPVDLGTRCTVFMNSKVKQAQKEGASVGDIAAGLAYSVIRNALYKVIKMSDPTELGRNIVAQGGSFRNDALLRALELQLEREVIRPELAELMGAFGAALIARERGPECASQEECAGGEAVSRLLSPADLENFTVKSSSSRCRGCTNCCTLTLSRFPDGSRFVSGNRCEKGAGSMRGGTPLPNLYAYKYQRLFEHYTPLAPEEAPRGSIGIPRALNMFENYPLWFTILTELGWRVELSAPSTKELYQLGYSSLPSQTACYPAKLAHGHVVDLINRGLETIFFPCIPLERQDFLSQNNSYNCPVVGGYPEILAYNIGRVREKNVNLLCPFLPLDEAQLARRMAEIPFFAGVDPSELRLAVAKGFAEWEKFRKDMREAGEAALEALDMRGALGVVLAAHPYHVDPEIHHGIADLVVSCGMAVLTEDSVAHLMPDPGPLRVVDQWTYHARLYRAGALAASRNNLAVLQLVSFGCGLDAITSDQLEELVSAKGRLYAQIKVDEGANLGPARIRIRSLLASLRRRSLSQPLLAPPPPPEPMFTEEMRRTHTILIPQMSPVHFQFLETVFQSSGYKVRQLPHVSRAALEMGLRYVHNDACYPAITVVGQLLHAMKSGEAESDKVAVLITQTGGGCRATNYVAFLRKALQDSGLGHVPVLTLNASGATNHPGFKISYRLMLRAFMAVFYGDALSRMIYRLRPYELVPGSVNAMAERWVEKGKASIRSGFPGFFHLDMLAMVKDFDRLPLKDIPRKPRVGLVGEILLKYHPDANNNAVQVLEAEGGEAVVPDLMDFVLYSLYDEIWRWKHLSGSWKSAVVCRAMIAVLDAFRWSVRWAMNRSSRFHAPLYFSTLQSKVKGLISLGQQTGEGWLLTAEMVELLEDGVPNILCLQPFGCLPNHITGKGMFKELKRRYPEANIAAVDYDPGASEVNQVNRIKLLMSLARQAVTQ